MNLGRMVVGVGAACALALGGHTNPATAGLLGPSNFGSASWKKCQGYKTTPSPTRSRRTAIPDSQILQKFPARTRSVDCSQCRMHQNALFAMPKIRAAISARNSSPQPATNCTGRDPHAFACDPIRRHDAIADQHGMRFAVDCSIALRRFCNQVQDDSCAGDIGSIAGRGDEWNVR